MTQLTGGVKIEYDGPIVSVLRVLRGSVKLAWQGMR